MQASASKGGDAYVRRWLTNKDVREKRDAWWFQLKIEEPTHPWAFKDGDPTPLLSAQGGADLRCSCISVISDTGGTFFGYCVKIQERPAMQLAPLHLTRECNQWAQPGKEVGCLR